MTHQQAVGMMYSRPSPLRARLIVRGRETLGKAWDETSRAHRRAGSRAPHCLDRKYVYTRERSTAKLLADSYIHVARQSRLTPTRTIRASNARACIRLYIVWSRQRGARDPGTQRLWARDVSSQARARQAFPVFNVSLPRTIKRAH